MYRLSNPVTSAPVAPKAAVVANAGMYLGAESAVKMLLDTSPMRLASGTPTEVKTTRRPSWGVLLLYQVESRTDGADVPQHIMNVAK